MFKGHFYVDIGGKSFCLFVYDWWYEEDTIWRAVSARLELWTNPTPDDYVFTVVINQPI